MIGWLIYIVVGVMFLLFMIFFPDKWTEIVKKENAYWRMKKIINEEMANWFISFETGIGLKILVLIWIALGFIGIFATDIVDWLIYK